MRLKYEFEVQESETLKRAIMETSLDSIITIDQDGRIVEINTTAEKVFGYLRHEAIGREFAGLLLDEESAARFPALWAGLHQGRAPADLCTEMTALGVGGKPFPAELAIKPLALHGRSMLTVYLRDITERKRAEQEILCLAKFSAESPSPVLRVNRSGVIIYANASSARLLEYWGCEEGQTLPPYWREQVGHVLGSGKVWEVDVARSESIFSLLFTPVVDLDYVNIYGRDISAVRHAENQARKHQQELVHVCRLSTMGEMATGLAHELNQPLSAIANYANGCARRLQMDNRDMRDIISVLEQINVQADRAGLIIKRLRSLVGKQQPVRTKADINQVVREVCSFVEFEARKLNVVIEQELTLSEMYVRIDVVQIEQVLLNLIRNALDALRDVPEEERDLIVRSGCSDEGRSVAVQVIDTGPGIPAEAMDRLFEPFFTTKSSGMGMGLIISKTIMEDHNGRITVGRWHHSGTTFTMTLPLHEPIRIGLDED
ncbi:MAG: ATP-binding protein [Candidatus Sedimenticola endophacoides]